MNEKKLSTRPSLSSQARNIVHVLCERAYSRSLRVILDALPPSLRQRVATAGDFEGNTPLHLAVRRAAVLPQSDSEGARACVEYLVSLPGSSACSLANKAGATPLQLAQHWRTKAPQAVTEALKRRALQARQLLSPPECSLLLIITHHLNTLAPRTSRPHATSLRASRTPMLRRSATAASKPAATGPPPPLLRRHLDRRRPLAPGAAAPLPLLSSTKLQRRGRQRAPSIWGSARRRSRRRRDLPTAPPPGAP